MKKRILIVEDDKFFRYAIKKSVDWEKYNFEIIGEAVHGQQAIEFIVENSVEVVITDMSMPIMGGIELTKTIKKLYPEILIIALSAYDDFEFVKESIKNGASDYILKQDIENSDIGSTVDKLWEKHIKELFANKERRDDIAHLISGMENHKKAAGCLEMLFGENSVYYLCVAKLNSKTDGLLLDSVNDNGDLIIENNSGYIFLNRVIRDNSLSRTLEKEREVISSIEKSLNMTNYCACISRVNPIISEIQSCYKSLCQSIDNISLYINRKVFTLDELRKIENEREPNYLADEKTYYSIFEQNDAIENIKRLTKRLNEKMPNDEYVLENYLLIINVLAGNLNYEITKTQYSIIKETLQNSNTLLEKEGCVIEYLKSIYEKISRRNIHPSVIKVSKYIRENYSKDISLNDIAQEVVMNESYISNLFKKEIGISIIEYTNNIRIKEAKRLVRETGLKNYEIAESIGISNASYFSTLFKKETGITIQEYRKGTASTENQKIMGENPK
ncbi:MAG: response regulator [Suipraeoptans sp.]